LDIIPLADAKTYLGVDDTSRDAEITQMIKAALSFIERNTNYIMEAVDKTYLLRDGCVRVYDYPINTADVDLDETVTRTNKATYSIYEDSSTAKTITLNVGGTTIPNDLIQAGYLLLEHFFNEKETGNRLYTLDTTRFPVASMQIIEKNKRFIL
jgi:hypothetical protein